MKREFKRVGFAVGAALLMASLAACGGGGGGDGSSLPASNSGKTNQTTEQQISQLEAAGTLPTLDRSNDVKGTASNSDGIRDDVEAVIAKTYPDSTQQKAAKQFAAVAQSQLLVDASNPAAVKAVATQSAAAINCLAQTFGTTTSPTFADVARALDADTANTKQRKLAQLAYSKAMDGAVISLPGGNTCE
jgi:hypothetical protein